MASAYTCWSCQRLLRSNPFRDAIQRTTRRYHGAPVRPSLIAPAKALGHSERWQSTAPPPQDPVQAPRYVRADGTPVADVYQAMAVAAAGGYVRVYHGNNETDVLARIPQDVRTYNWRTPEWTFGVLERLFQDCEQAKVRFVLEDYIDEEDGKTRRRVVTNANGQHVGEGEGWWFDAVGLPKTFNTWAVVCFLHMWILKVRIRHLPRRMANHWNELLTNHFFWTAEKTMDFEHKIDATQRKKYLDNYFQVWTGAILALDEGLVKGDAVLAAALWRLLFDSAADVDPARLALATAYVRRELARVAALDDAALARGYVGFGEPLADDVLAKQSPWMRMSFEEEPVDR